MWVVIQVTETGEEVGRDLFRSEDHAWLWIDQNCENFPESTFYVERE